MTTVLVRLQTTKCSGLFGNNIIQFMGISAAPLPPNDLYVWIHSVVFKLQILMDPSDDALITLWLSGVKAASFTKDVCPLNSLIHFPDFRPCNLKHVITTNNIKNWKIKNLKKVKNGDKPNRCIK